MSEFSCPHCRQPIRARAAAPTVCPHCRRELALPKPPRWFYARGRERLGPCTLQQLRTLVTRGDLSADDMLLLEGTMTWFRAGELTTLFAGRAKKRSMPWLLAGVMGAACCAFLAAGLSAGYLILARLRPPDQPQAEFNANANADKKARADRQIKKDEPPQPKRAVAKPIPPEGALWAEQFAERLNQYRALAGLGPVHLDGELSRGCQAHAAYLARHLDWSKPQEVNVFAEDAAKPGYSDEGARAAAVSTVVPSEPLPALERWMAQLVSRVALLNPEVQSVGLGFAKNAAGRWISVLDATRGRGEPIVVYPISGQTDVPLSFSGGVEVPDPKAPAGFPITVMFPPSQQLAAGRLELRDAHGSEVDGWRFSPDQPLRAGPQRNALALIPKATLKAGAVYFVKASATVDGKEWENAWSFTTEDDADTKGLWAKKVLVKVNAYRAHAGLAPVVLEDQLSHGCLAHARYLAINEGHPALAGLQAHDEDLSLAGASQEGRAAGKASDIATGDYEPTDAVAAWMATLYHRVPILEPNLRSIGFGCARGRRFGWVTVMNVVAGRGKGPRPRAVFYPAADQIDVPISFPNGGEEPTPIPDDKDGKAGYPVTAFFPPNATPTNATGKLTKEAGEDVPCWFSSQEKRANPALNAAFQGTTICLIAKDPLHANTTYHVHLQGQLAGKAWQKKWKFTTGAAGASVAHAYRQVIERLNHFRLQAGLAAVKLDDDLRRGCQLHADYLVKNADALQKGGASVNDENPLLPGFTAAGRRSAQRSDVFTNAPVPVTQIDDLLATFTRRVRLLDPTLQRIGFGCTHDIGRGWRCVLDLNAGRGDARIIRYPAPDQAGVPVHGFDRLDAASGKPVGFPISVTFPKQAKIGNVQAVLTLDDAAIEVHISTPRTPIQGQTQGTTVGVHPLAPLQPGRTYAVTVSVIVDGAEWRQTWQFTTAKEAG